MLEESARFNHSYRSSEARLMAEIIRFLLDLMMVAVITWNFKRIAHLEEKLDRMERRVTWAMKE